MATVIERDHYGFALDYPERVAELDAAKELMAKATREKLNLDAALAEAKVNRFGKNAVKYDEWIRINRELPLARKRVDEATARLIAAQESVKEGGHPGRNSVSAKVIFAGYGWGGACDRAGSSRGGRLCQTLSSKCYVQTL